MNDPTKRQCDESLACFKFRQKWVGRRVRYTAYYFDYGHGGGVKPYPDKREGVVVAIGEIQRRMRNPTGILVVEVTATDGKKWEDREVLAKSVEVLP